MTPLPQQTWPLAQLVEPWHCQSVESFVGQVVASGSHCETRAADAGGSQQCWPLGQYSFFPPSVVALKGQYIVPASSGG
jgi:hypothetical protein